MSIKVIGAGVGRTGTMSLKRGLEKLLGEPCYHMYEVFQHMDHVSSWHSAANGEMPDWENMFQGYGAAVDWPVASFWPELSKAYPDALIILSVRDRDAWWKSAHETIFRSIGSGMPEHMKPWHEMVMAFMSSRFTPWLNDKEACQAAFDRHYAKAYEEANPKRLVVWQASDGWEPLCNALGVQVPDEPFPHTNTTDEFLARIADRKE